MLRNKFNNQDIALISSFETELNLEPHDHSPLTCIEGKLQQLYRYIVTTSSIWFENTTFSLTSYLELFPYKAGHVFTNTILKLLSAKALPPS